MELNMNFALDDRNCNKVLTFFREIWHALIINYKTEIFQQVEERSEERRVGKECLL